jgi:hypothetical protein
MHQTSHKRVIKMNISRRVLLLAGSSFLTPFSSAFADGCSFAKPTGKAISSKAREAALGLGALGVVVGAGSIYLGFYAAATTVAVAGALSVTAPALAVIGVGLLVVAGAALLTDRALTQKSKEICERANIKTGVFKL